MKATNALLLKLNQIGTVSEAFDAARMAFRNGFKVMASHRSAETEDSALADVTVALGAEILKTGAPLEARGTPSTTSSSGSRRSSASPPATPGSDGWARKVYNRGVPTAGPWNTRSRRAFGPSLRG